MVMHAARRRRLPLILAAVLLGGIAGCHKQKPPEATAQDIDAARQEAAREVTEARKEAAKDVKSAEKIAGENPRGVVEAKVTGSYDVAMAKADGDHKVASEQCLTQPADQQKACQEQADADYDTAKTSAKAARTAKHP